ncbi:MAG: serine/threonine protein kinase [Gemmatimonadales bacterium]|nr:serine/threonine protein kinase [Gemmatimonadales bacterium]MBA3556543.1 serine/threonine protein kinase [Gemmatimonadales bacterium]
MATDLDSRATLIRDDPAPSRSARQTSSWSLPPDLLGEAVLRVRAAALLYALAYFLAAFLPELVVADARERLAADPGHWIPGVLSIADALIVAWLVSQPWLSSRLKLYAGLAFEVLGSFGIAAMQYQHITAPIGQGDTGTAGFGLSWVAAFVLLFSVMVPMPPRIMLLSTGLSVAAVPLTYAAGVALGTNLALGPGEFFFTLVFPYLIIMIMAYVGSRVVYRLGAAVREAREMGSYRLVQRLGEGGMGEVWRAQHRMLARPAAIKLIRPEVLGARDSESRDLLVRRFEREAQATALMRSAHTMALYDFGVADDGTFYYVMELLDGFDLDQLVRRFGPVPAERAVHFLRQICASLAEAHEAGLIHRDIKPANVYACRYGREVDFVKVLDFGLVKHGRPAEPGAGELTMEEGPSGTPAFMSPEQALGEKRVDARSDIYAVGCVAYWLLTGTLVFRGVTAMETIVMHVHGEVEPPSHRAELPVPAELEAIVLACLAKKPGGRPQTADELAERLASVSLEREWTGWRAREWWDRHQPADPSDR